MPGDEVFGFVAVPDEKGLSADDHDLGGVALAVEQYRRGGGTVGARGCDGDEVADVGFRQVDVPRGEEVALA